MKFGNYDGVEETTYVADKQYTFKLDNGYGASILQGGLIGTRAPYWELAVIRWDDKYFTIDYDTPITDDVIGPLNDDEVVDILEKIEKL